MRRKVSESILTFFETVAAGIWLGSLVTLGMAVAGTIFRHAGSINLAGELNAKVISKIHIIELSCCSLLVLCLVYQVMTKERNTILYVKTSVLSVMLLTMMYYVFVLMPELEDIRLNIIKDFDNMPSYLQPQRDVYGELHKRYTTLVSVVVFSLISYLAIFAIEKHPSK